jgi:hypothetical protein
MKADTGNDRCSIVEAILIGGVEAAQWALALESDAWEIKS